MRLAPHDVVELAEIAHVVGEGSRVERRKGKIAISECLHTVYSPSRLFSLGAARLGKGTLQHRTALRVRDTDRAATADQDASRRSIPRCTCYRSERGSTSTASVARLFRLDFCPSAAVASR